VAHGSEGKIVVSQDVRTNVCNVLVIGAGAAGLRSAIAAHQAGTEVVVLAKRANRDAHTVLASGGINAALATVDPDDSWQQHFADTLREGYFLADPRVVEICAREAPAAIREVDSWGSNFARTSDGEIDQRYFGAHKYRRTCYAGDFTGRALLNALAEQVAEFRIPVVDNQYASRLLVTRNTCFGALTFDQNTGERTAFLADAVVLATGGHTRVWRRTTSRRDENNGDGMWLALQAGCRLADMELVQFHPTGMVWPEDMAGTLVTEAVRGEGGRLLNADGERFMSRYDPDRMELSTRDRVALANYTEIMNGRGGPHGGVLLDISHRDKEFILRKLPRMYRQFIELQLLDISREPMEVAPTAHYSMGGVVIDPETHATDVEGLYAAGEVTAGLHGANRLGGNSLTETLVFGRRAGAAAAAASRAMDAPPRSKEALEEALDELDGFVHNGSEIVRPVQRALRDTMWECCGVVRSEEKLNEGLSRISELEAALPSIDVRPTAEGYGDLAHVLDLRASLATAEATLRGASARKETRGCHNRSDYIDLDSQLTVNFHVTLSDGRMELTSATVPPVPSHLEAWAEAGAEVDAAGRLLE
jgi:succinate dehydrogenase / fumarate reductase flavoprotein subunit